MIALLAMANTCLAQLTVAEARVSSVSGIVTVKSDSLAAFPVSAGFLLNPGDEIDTRAGGRITIDLSDGSQVTVRSGSLVRLRDFRSASSLRELLEITLGHIRVRINHLGGKPNPYRVNSPTASIAVRGTEFTVDVDAAGATGVSVIEGRVAVSRRGEPANQVLVEAGRGVFVRTGGGPQFFAPYLTLPRENQNDDDNGPSTTAGAYEEFVAGLANTEQPAMLRYNAFPELHLDSLENPALAAGFKSAEGQINILPFRSDLEGLTAGDSLFATSGEPSVRGVSTQATYFVPYKSFVIGGALTASAVYSGSGSSRFLSGSAILARKLGERGSLGVEVEHLKGTGSLLAASPFAADATAKELSNSLSDISQTRLTAGFAHDLGTHHQGSAYARYGFIDASDAQVSHRIGGLNVGLDSIASAGHAIEFGARLRGELTPRLIYGANVSWLGLSLDSGLARSTLDPSHQADGANRATGSFGLGLLIKQHAVVSADVATGWASISGMRTADTTAAVLQNGSAGKRFLSLHAALQLPLWRRLYGSSSYVETLQRNNLRLNLFPDSTGKFVVVHDSFLPLELSQLRSAPHLAELGLGWRFTNNVILQYSFASDFQFSQDSNTVMFRYTFANRGE